MALVGFGDIRSASRDMVVQRGPITTSVLTPLISLLVPLGVSKVSERRVLRTKWSDRARYLTNFDASKLIRKVFYVSKMSSSGLVIFDLCLEMWSSKGVARVHLR